LIAFKFYNDCSFNKKIEPVLPHFNSFILCFSWLPGFLMINPKTAWTILFQVLLGSQESRNETDHDSGLVA